jgi:predicted pyridoxine 5'-phosphate oxidase superfamily flavin-nucleotide-binding protein
MGYRYGQVMFGEATRKLQAEHGSGAQYARMMAAPGSEGDELGAAEIDFIGRRDSFYMASVTPDGWPYMQHRGGPKGFLRVIDAKTLAFADFAGNKQYISTGDFATNDRVSLFLMDYPNQARLKLIGHASVLVPGDDAMLDNDKALHVPAYPARIERLIRIDVTAFDWNCSQHIRPRFTREEWTAEG